MKLWRRIVWSRLMWRTWWRLWTWIRCDCRRGNIMSASGGMAPGGVWRCDACGRKVDLS